MKIFKKIFAFALTLSLVIPMFALAPFAADGDWIYIDGENITRQPNMAIVYKDVPATGQNQWGYDIVVDSESRVTQIIEGGNAEGGNLDVPEGGMVISAGGTKVEWFEDNIDVGDTVFYDSYSQRLFVRDYYGSFEPYFSEYFQVNEVNGEYILSDSESVENAEYVYKVIVNADGIIVSRGGNDVVPEGGFAVCAVTEAQREILVTHGIIGAECEYSDGFVTFTFENSMLSRSATLAVENAKQTADRAKSQYAYIDTAKLDEVISNAESKIGDVDGYRALSGLLVSLEKEMEEVCADNGIYELRGAFHVPTETNSTEVSATVLKAKAAGLNTIILRVTNGYGTFIPLPDSFRFKQDEKFKNFDVLQSFIDVCEKENMALTLCIETYYNEYASIAAPEWLSVSNGEETGLANKYFSPASKEFQGYFIQYVEYIITHYHIESLMFDFLRYPKFTENSDLGYDSNTLQLFATQEQISVAELENLKTELQNSKYWDKWVEFKTSLVDNMAKSLSELVRGERSDITLLAVAERDIVDYYYMQDAFGWIENGWFDGLTVAVFEADTAENDKLPDNSYYGGIVEDKMQDFAERTGENAYLFTAIEVSASHHENALQNAISESRSVGADGFVFGKLSDFIGQNYHLALEDNVLKGNSVSPMGDENYAMKEILEYSKLKINNSILKYGACDEETVSKANSIIDTALSSLETAVLTVEQAKQLETDISTLFAESLGKDSVMKEYKALTKLALLGKEEIDFQPPVDEPDPDNSQGGISQGDAASSEESLPDHSQNQSDRIEINIDFGKVLIYGFVGVTFIAVIAAMVVGIRRKQDRPKNAHMPKGSAEGYEKKDKD